MVSNKDTIAVDPDLDIRNEDTESKIDYHDDDDQVIPLPVHFE